MAGSFQPNALPSVRSRALAFLSIVVAGAAGALIGYGVVEVQCHGSCRGAVSIGALVGAVVAAGGVAVVAVLVLRAMGEWHGNQQGEADQDQSGI